MSDFGMHLDHATVPSKFNILNQLHEQLTLLHRSTDMSQLRYVAFRMLSYDVFDHGHSGYVPCSSPCLDFRQVSFGVFYSFD
jgi:hypothetical protein